MNQQRVYMKIRTYPVFMVKTKVGIMEIPMIAMFRSWTGTRVVKIATGKSEQFRLLFH